MRHKKHGLYKNLQPFRDYQLAKKFAWDPQQLDLRADARDWLILDDREQDVALNLLSMFVKGEEAVASELAPYGDDVPFGIDLQEMTEYALVQFNKRLGAVERVAA